MTIIRNQKDAINSKFEEDNNSDKTSV